MTRREFHKATLAGAAAVGAGAVGWRNRQPTPFPPHPGDLLPPGGRARLGSHRFFHPTVGGNPGLSALAFSPDDQLLAGIAYEDGTASLWAVPDGRVVRRWDTGLGVDHDGCLAFIPDGRRLATGSSFGLVLWDVATGREVRRLPVGEKSDLGGVRAVAFTPAGQVVVAATYPHEHPVRVFDADAGRELLRVGLGVPPDAGLPSPWRPSPWEDWVEAVAVSPDGRLLAVGTRFAIVHDVTDAATDPDQARLLERFAANGGGSWNDRRFVPEGRGRVFVFALPAGTPVGRFDGPVGQQPFGGGVVALGFTADGEVVAVGADGVVRTHRLADGSTREARWADGAAALAPGAGRLAVARPGFVGLVDPATGRELRALAAAPGSYGMWPVAAGDRWVAAATRQRVHLWDGESGADASPPGRHADAVSGLAFARDGRRAVTWDWDAVAVWGAATGELRATAPVGRRLRADTVAVAPDAGRVAGINPDAGDPKARRVAVWDAAAGDVREWAAPHAAAVAWLDADTLAVAGDDRAVVARRFDGTDPGRVFDPAPSAALALGMSPDGRTLVGVAGDPGGTLVAAFAWDAATGRRTCPALLACRNAGSGAAAELLAVSADGRLAAIECAAGVAVFDAVGGGFELAVRYPPVSREPDRLSTAAMFRPDGRLLLAVSRGSTPPDDPAGCTRPYWAEVRDVADGSVVWRSPDPAYMPCVLRFTPDGRGLAAGLGDATAVIWDLDEGAGR